MLVLIRMIAEEKGRGLRDHIVAHRKGGMIWNFIDANRGALNQALAGTGRMLYMTLLAKRVQRGDVSLMIHVSDPKKLGPFLVERVGAIPGVTSFTCIGLYAPHFFPVPKDTSGYQRYSIAVDTEPGACAAVYEEIKGLTQPEGMPKTYIWYNFGDFGSTIQFSVLTEDESSMRSQLGRYVATIRGVRGYEVMPVEATRPLIRYDEWTAYAKEHRLTTAWDDHEMIREFEL
jgi:hypothetical protein